MKINLKLSLDIAAKNIKIKEQDCYYNSTICLSEVNRLSDVKNGLYVEGIIVDFDLSLFTEHGWIEKDNEIIDVTLVKFWRKGVKVKYYPCFKYTFDEMMVQLLNSKGRPPFFKNNLESQKDLLKKE